MFIPHGASGRFWGSGLSILMVVAFAAAVLVLVSSEQPNVMTWLPWLLVAACPLMHVLSHRGHRTHRHPDPEDSRQRNEPN
jgi:hypothetical protein